MELRVTRAQKVFSDGKHNAFTTLASFQGSNYLAFRSGTTHLTMDGEIVVLKQAAAGGWSEVKRFAVPDHDLRDPNLIVFNGQMLLYSMTRVQRNNTTSTETYMWTTSDDEAFTEIGCLKGLNALWGLAQKDGILYASNYKLKAGTTFYYPSLWQSSDGITWDLLLDYPFPGTEVALDFDEDGSLWTLVRDSTETFGAIPSICQILPPYTKMQERSFKTFEKILALPMRLQGPMLKRLHGYTVIAGRTWQANRSNLRTSIFLWQENQDLQHVCDLPSGGDTSYPAWLDTTPGHALLSYYSAHEHRMALTFEEEAITGHPHAEHCTAADIFVADICWKI